MPLIVDVRVEIILNLMKNFLLALLEKFFLLDMPWQLDFHCHNDAFYNDAIYVIG